MTEKYTPEKVAELVAESRVKHCSDCDHFISAMGAALAALSAKLDRERAVSKPHRPSARAWASIVERAEDAEDDRDRLHKAITEALAAVRREYGSYLLPYSQAERVLRAALDKEGGDDE